MKDANKYLVLLTKYNTLATWTAFGVVAVFLLSSRTFRTFYESTFGSFSVSIFIAAFISFFWIQWVKKNQPGLIERRAHSMGSPEAWSGLSMRHQLILLSVGLMEFLFAIFLGLGFAFLLLVFF